MNKSTLLLAIMASPLYASESPESLEQITVTATKLTRNISDVAGTVSVISAQQLEQQIANDLDDLVRYQPGLSMDTAGRGGNQGFIIRGIGGNRVLTVLDGVRSNDIYSAGPASYGRDVFEVDDLSRVEVIRGPASVLYGADALGGAVILSSKNPEDYLTNGKDSYLALRASGSSADEQGKLGLTAAHQENNWGFVTQYTHRDFKEKTIEGGAQLNPQDGDSDSLLLKTVWTPSSKHQASLTLDTLRENIDYQLNSEISNSVSASIGRDESERYRVSLAHQWSLNSNLADEINTQIFWQKNEALQNTVQQRNSYSFAFAPFGTSAERVTDFEFNQEVKGFSSTLNKSFVSDTIQHAMVYGISHEVTHTERPRNRCETEITSGARTCDILAYPFSGAESFPNRTFPNTKTTRSGLFWQNEMQLGGSGFTLIPGIRYDHYKMDANLADVVDIAGFSLESLSENDVSLNLGLIYSLNEQVSLFAQYAEGFRPPNFDEANQSFVNLNFNYATVPNPELKPETSRGFELGAKVQMASAYLSIAFYNNEYDDFIDSQFVGEDQGISLYQDRNIGKARIYGAEVNGTWQFKPNWRAHGAIAYAHGDDNEAKRPLDTVEPLNGVFGLAYEALNQGWGVETVLTLVAKKDRVSADNLATNKAYAIVDVFGHYQLTPSTKVKVGLFNVMNKTYARWANIEGLSANSSNIALAQESGAELRMGVNTTF